MNKVRRDRGGSHHLLFILLLIVTTLLVYADSFRNSFVYDDYPLVVENQHIRTLNLKSIISNFTSMNSSSSLEDLARDIWRPFTTSSFAIDYRIWKLNPHLYHVENTFWHILNAVLVYAVTFLILENSLASLLAALVFAVHPVQTEAVTSIAGRANVLFLFFFLAAFIFHIRNRRYRENGLNYNLSLILFTFSLFSKEMAIVLPLVLILYDLHFYKPKNLKYYIGYYSPYFLITVFYILARFSVLGTVAQKSEWWGGSLLVNVLITMGVLAKYIGLLLLPVGLKVGYTADIPKSILDPSLIASVSILLAVLLVYLAYRKRREASFYILWFFITLIPVYNIVPFKAPMAERFLYLPLIGFASLLGIAISMINRGPDTGRSVRAISNIIIAVILAGYGAMTISRNLEWRDEITFSRQEVLRSNAKAKFYYMTGAAYERNAKNAILKDDVDSYRASAIEEFKKAAAFDPNYQVACLGMANAYNATGDYDLAIENFKKAIAVEENFGIYNNLAIAYCHKGMYDEAIRCCKRSLYLMPAIARVYVNLGNAYYGKGEYAKAKRCWSEAVRLGEGIPTLMRGIEELKKMGY